MKNSIQKTTFAGLISAVCLILSPALASAEAGDGVEGENFKLKLSASAGTSVNSNLFYQENPTAPSALALVISPGMSLSSTKTDKVALSLNWGLSWTQFLSSNNALSQQSGFATDLGAAAHFNQGGNLSLRLEENLQRTNDPPNGPNVNAINRFNNKLGGIVGIHPGGRALQAYLSYHWTSINFNNPDINLAASNRDEHALQGRFVWQFRPRTAALLTANYTFVNYDQPTRVVGGATLDNFDSRPLRLTAGLNGLITRKLSAELTAGYGRAGYVAGPSFSGFIGRALLGYYIDSAKNNKLALAYTRSFSDTFIGNFVLANRFDLTYTQPLINDRLKVDLGAFYARRNYAIPSGGVIPLPGSDVVLPPNIIDNRIGAGLGLGFSIKKWLSVKGGYQLNSNISDSNVSIARGEDVAGRSYIQHIVNASVMATY